MGRNRYTPAEQEFYRRYLNSPAWRARRLRALELAGRRCQFETFLPGSNAGPRCTRTRYLDVHHQTYARLGREQDSDLLVVCWAHHMIEHLLWQRCASCTRVILGYDTIAEEWLAQSLFRRGIDLDNGPENRACLPNKEELIDEAGRYCSECLHLVR